MTRILIAGCIAACAWAQAPSEVPPLIQIVRQPGSGRAPARPYANVQAGVNVLGMVAITGTPETWLVEMHGSFASIEDLDRGLNAGAPAPMPADPGAITEDLLAPARTMIAMYRPGWSYRPVDAMRILSRSRYYLVTVYQIRAGTEADFGELVRLRRATSDAVNLDRPELAYSVISGAPGGTFLFLAPLTSLRKMDEGAGPLPTYAEALAAVRASAGSKIRPDAEISRERLIFRVDPRISYVSEAFAEADTGFWRGGGSSR